MKIIIVIVTCFILSACHTYLYMEADDERTENEQCREQNRREHEGSKRECGESISFDEAVNADIEVAKEINEIVKKALAPEAEVPPSYEGKDSQLCKATENKVCSASNGCYCKVKTGAQ